MKIFVKDSMGLLCGGMGATVSVEVELKHTIAEVKEKIQVL